MGKPTLPPQAATYLGPPLAAQRGSLAGFFRPVANTDELKQAAGHIARCSRQLPYILEALGLPLIPEEEQFWAGTVLPVIVDEIERRQRPLRAWGSNSPLARLKAMDIVALASRFTDLKPAGPGKLKGRCPLHQERTPSFYVYEDTKRWWCFGACAGGGDVIELFQRLVNLGVLS
ncbi:MAG: CHC2 zinc finger domain-containing protein [Dehalococcoidia bacterium]